MLQLNATPGSTLGKGFFALEGSLSGIFPPDPKGIRTVSIGDNSLTVHCISREEADRVTPLLQEKGWENIETVDTQK